MVAAHFRATGEWLTRLHRATRQPARTLGEAAVCEQIEQPLAEARRYFGSKVIPDALYDAIIRQAREHLGCRVSLVDEHGDFWPSNLLLARGRISVIDWEHFRPAVLPGFDMLVFCAAYSMHFPWRPFGWADPRMTFAATFLRTTWMTKYAMILLNRGCASSGLPRTLVPVLLPIALCRMAVRLTQAASQQDPGAPITGWLQMLEEWWRRPSNNPLEEWARKEVTRHP
jgi:aminoglycoside phosphotransferase (APT) family kinase protein